ncbi:MAG: PIN domain-containing protein [Geminicoccaceae bacterium]
MTRLLVDSSVWIDHLRGVDSRETRILRGMLRQLDPLIGDKADDEITILVGDLVLVEVLRGIESDGQRRRVRDALLAFDVVQIGGIATALAAAEHDAALRRIGQTVRKAIDCLIAAWCIEQGVPLLQADRDFLPLARHRGLRLA